LVTHDAQPQDPQPPPCSVHVPPGDLDLPLHPHLIVEPGPQPTQVEPIPTQVDTVPKVSAIRRKVKRTFQEEEGEHYDPAQLDNLDKLFYYPKIILTITQVDSRICGCLKQSWLLLIAIFKISVALRGENFFNSLNNHKRDL
jgi:hypothetical protein